MAFRRTGEAPLGQDNSYRLTRNQLRFIKRLRSLTLDNCGTAIVTVGLGVFENLFFDHRLQACSAAERFIQRCALFIELVLLAPDLHFLELGKIAQPEVQNGLGLHIAEFEFLHQHWLGLIFPANDRDDLVDIEVGSQQAIENMQPVGNDL